MKARTLTFARMGNLTAIVIAVMGISNAHAANVADPLADLPTDAKPAAKVANATPKAAPSRTTAPVQAAGASSPQPAPAPAAAKAPSTDKPELPVAQAGTSGKATADSRSAPAPSVTSAAPAKSVAPSGVATLRQLDDLRSQNALLSEMVKAAELRAKLSGQGDGGGTPSPRRAPLDKASLAMQAVQAAQVLSVYGVDGKLTAVVGLLNGATVKAQEGTVIPGLGSVKSITRNSVLVNTGSATVGLNFIPVGSGQGAR